MQYFGGKAKICKSLAAYINSLLKPDQPYWEPFCGGCWVISNIDPVRLRIASDAHLDLVQMWCQILRGWIPPSQVSEEYYLQLKSSTPSAVRGFVGFGCSNSGKWFGGYARDGNGRNYAGNAHNSTLKKIIKMQDVSFSCCDYREYEPPEGCLIYCDPPYRGRPNIRPNTSTMTNSGTGSGEGALITRSWSRSMRLRRTSTACGKSQPRRT